MVNSEEPCFEHFDKYEAAVASLQEGLQAATEAAVAREKELGKRVKRAQNKVSTKRKRDLCAAAHNVLVSASSTAVLSRRR